MAKAGHKGGLDLDLKSISFDNADSLKANIQSIKTVMQYLETVQDTGQTKLLQLDRFKQFGGTLPVISPNPARQIEGMSEYLQATGQIKVLKEQLKLLEEALISLEQNKTKTTQEETKELEKQVQIREAFLNIYPNTEATNNFLDKNINNIDKLKYALDNTPEVDDNIKKNKAIALELLKTEEERAAERFAKAVEEAFDGLKDDADKFGDRFKDPIDKQIDDLIEERNKLADAINNFIGPDNKVAQLKAELQILEEQARQKIRELETEENAKVAEEMRKGIEDENKERERQFESINQMAGDFGKLIEDAQGFQKLFNEPIVMDNPELTNLLEGIIGEILKIEQQPDPKSKFIGLTDAWRDIQVSTKKKDEALRQKQLELAQQLIDKAGISNELLKKILDKELKIK
jgi:hypothetical protein